MAAFKVWLPCISLLWTYPKAGNAGQISAYLWESLHMAWQWEWLTLFYYPPSAEWPGSISSGNRTFKPVNKSNWTLLKAGTSKMITLFFEILITTLSQNERKKKWDKHWQDSSTCTGSTLLLPCKSILACSILLWKSAYTYFVIIVYFYVLDMSNLWYMLKNSACCGGLAGFVMGFSITSYNFSGFFSGLLTRQDITGFSCLPANVYICILWACFQCDVERRPKRKNNHTHVSYLKA